MTIELYFSQHFGVSPKVLEDYGAFDISLASDLPLFIDPFLLFNSQKPEYRDLHEGMIRYLVFLRDRATPDLDPGLIKSWYIGWRSWTCPLCRCSTSSGRGNSDRRPPSPGGTLRNRERVVDDLHLHLRIQVLHACRAVLVVLVDRQRPGVNGG